MSNVDAVSVDDDDVFAVELDLESLDEIRRTLSMTMTKLEKKMREPRLDPAIHRETSRVHNALERAYDEIRAAIKEASGL
jgi:hypothetical protein